MKKTLGFIVTLVLLLSVFSVTAFADDADESNASDASVCAHENQHWEQITDGCALICLDCGETLVAEQPHDYRIVGEYDEEEDFEIYGCEGQRSRGVMCSRCECMSRTDIEPLGHNFVNGVCTRCAKADPNYTAPTNPPAESTSAPIAAAPVEVTTEEATTPDSTEATEEDSTEEPDEDTTAESAEEQIVIVEAVEEVEEEEILDGAEPEAKNAGAAPEQDDAPTTGTVVSDTADDHKWIWIAVGAAGAAAAAAVAAVFIIRAKKVK